MTPGDLIIDPFAGSGAILKMGSCFGAITMSSDVDSICCAHSALHKVRTTVRAILCFTYLQYIVTVAILKNIPEESEILQNILAEKCIMASSVYERKLRSERYEELSMGRNV